MSRKGVVHRHGPTGSRRSSRRRPARAAPTGGVPMPEEGGGGGGGVGGVGGDERADALRMNGATVRLAVACIALCCVVGGTSGARTPEEWKTRTIYQVLVDRFAQDFDGGEECADLVQYCGGTFNGLTRHLDYVQAMGFNALWISPVVENTPGGYHGYWAKDISQINAEFGTREDLHRLVEEAHKRDIWIMVDAVANHMGYVDNEDFSTLWPFNQPGHYNDCTGCGEGCDIHDWDNLDVIEHCRLAGLPDLNQDDPYVRQTLLNWIADLVVEFNIDGLRLDTIPEVKKEFWREFNDAAGCFAMGEYFNGDSFKLASFQQDGFDSLLAYGMYYSLRDVFLHQQSATKIPERKGVQKEAFADTTVLGNFVDNHDNNRFLHDQSDLALYRNALAYVILGEGIPVIYYGTEHNFAGGHDPQNRESLWQTGYSMDTPNFQLLSTLNKHRTTYELWKESELTAHASDQCFAFMRGDTLVVLTNIGGGSDGYNCEFNSDLIPPATRFDRVYPVDKGEVVSFEDGHMIIELFGGEPQVFIKTSGIRPEPVGSGFVPFVPEPPQIPENTFPFVSDPPVIPAEAVPAPAFGTPEVAGGSSFGSSFGGGSDDTMPADAGPEFSPDPTPNTDGSLPGPVQVEPAPVDTAPVGSSDVGSPDVQISFGGPIEVRSGTGETVQVFTPSEGSVEVQTPAGKPVEVRSRPINPQQPDSRTDYISSLFDRALGE